MRTLILAITAFAAVWVPATAQFAPPIPSPTQLASPGLTRIHGSVEGGWYASSDIYKYIADLNVSFDFGRWKDARIAFRGGILTLIKTTDEDNFQPDRYRGNLEPFIYLHRGDDTYAFSIRHQSFHTIDRAPTLEESYELYNISYQHRGVPHYRIAVGRYANRQDVDYEWDILAEIGTDCLGLCRYGPIYGTAIGHFVTESETLSDRGSFFDYSLEIGVETQADVKYFTALRLVHDIDQFDGQTDHQWVVGIKYNW